MTERFESGAAPASLPRSLCLAFVLFFLLCAGAHLSCSLIGFSDPLTRHHGFRKAQTAISTYYTLRDGFKINYETPVLGAPWSIPMEFPLYQWAVAAWTQLTGMPLDMSGRSVALLFFYLCLPLLFLLGRTLGLSRTQSLLPLCLVLLCPLYIYWSRTFMIESMALFFSLAFLLCFVRFRLSGRGWLLGLAVACGLLAGLVKVTTLFVSSVPVILWGAADAWRALRGPDKGKHLARTAGTYALALGLPLAAALAWTHYADSVKARNPMADLLLSSQLTSWNFGAFAFRFSRTCWSGYLAFVRTTQIGPLYGLLALAPLLVLKTRFRLWALLALCAYLAGPLVFANLYYVHDYYSYANTVFLLLAMTCGLLALQKLRWGGVASLVLLAGVAACLGYGYTRGYFSDQVSGSPVPPQCLLLRRVTAPDEVVFINNQDWNSYGPYYAQRRALMNYKNLPLDTPKLQKAIALTGREKITAVSGKFLPQPLFEFFNLHPEPIFSDIYLRKDTYARAYATLFSVDLASSGPPDLLRVAYWKGHFLLAVAPVGDFALPVPPGARTFSAQVVAPAAEGTPAAGYRGYCVDGSATPEPLFERDIPQPGALTLEVALPDKNCHHLKIVRNRQDPQTLSYWMGMSFR